MNWKVDCEDCEYSKLITAKEEYESIEERAKVAREAHANFRSHTVTAEPVDDEEDTE